MEKSPKTVGPSKETPVFDRAEMVMVMVLSRSSP